MTPHGRQGPFSGMKLVTVMCVKEQGAMVVEALPRILRDNCSTLIVRS